MPAALPPIGEAIASFFTTTAPADAAAATAGSTAASTALATTAGTETGAAAATAAAATGNAAIGATGINAAAAASGTATGAAGGLGTGLSASELATAATGASALYTLAQGRQNLNLPPTPGVATQDVQIQNAQQMALAREQAAGGLQSTTGTAGGQAGAILSPGTTSSRSILGG